MISDKITIRVKPSIAKAFRRAPARKKRNLEMLVNLRLLEATNTTSSLSEIIRETSRSARARGLTPEILREILNEEK
jgi:hypothetical protein